MYVNESKENKIILVRMFPEKYILLYCINCLNKNFQ